MPDFGPAWSRPIRDGLVAAAIGCVVGLLALAGLFRSLDDAFLAQEFALRGVRTPAGPVCIAAIDEASLERFGQMPWNRVIFANLVDELGAAGAGAIGFDVAFVERGRMDSSEDQQFAAAIKRFGRVVLAVHRPLQSGPTPSRYLIPPIGALDAAASGVGLAQFNSVRTISVLEVEPQFLAGKRLVPGLGIAVARAFRGQVSPDSPWMAPADSAGHERPVLLDVLGPAGAIPTFSICDILDRKVGAKQLRGKAVLVGATAAGLPDTGFSGVFGGPVPGVELHATVAENALSGRGLTRTSLVWNCLGWLLLLVFPVASLAGSLPRSSRKNAALLGAGLFAAFLVAWLAFEVNQISPVVAPAALLGASAIVGLARRESGLLRDRARILTWYSSDLAKEANRERQQIDGELHDEAQQVLAVIGLELQKLQREPWGDRLGEVAGLTRRVQDEIVRVRKALVPRTLSREGLVAAAEEIARDLGARTGMTVSVHAASWPKDVDPLLESGLYWLLKEALNNAAKHARASAIEVVLWASANKVGLRVSDDGAGFTPMSLEIPPTGHSRSGLHRMWLRAQGLGGDLKVTSSPGQGCLLTFEFPKPGAS